MHLVQNRVMSLKEVATRLGQSAIDLHDAGCLGLSPGRQLAFAYEGARQAAVACLGELGIDHRNDVEIFAAVCEVLNLGEAAARESASFTKQYNHYLRTIHSGIPVSADAAAHMLTWANAVVSAIRQQFINGKMGMFFDVLPILGQSSDPPVKMS
jgi:hypothetical protein